MVGLLLKIASMSWGGHALQMNQTMKRNRALRHSVRRKFRGGNNYNSITREETTYHFPQYSDSNLSKIKRRSRERRIKKRRIETTLYILIILLTFVGLYVFNTSKL